MLRCINDYGMLVTVKAKKNSFLFFDGIDQDRYISSLLKMTKKYGKENINPLFGGINNETAFLIFDGGNEDILRDIMRKVHISYAAYRKNKKFPVRFCKSSFELLDGNAAICSAVKELKEMPEIICLKFYCIKENNKNNINFIKI